MDAVETALRNALEKGDALDRAFREKVYRSAVSALDRSLKARPDLPPDAAEGRRRHLEARIREIETEFTPAVEPEPEPLLAEPDLTLDEMGPPAHPVPPAAEPRLSALDERRNHREKPARRLPVGWLLALAALLLLAAGAWWLVAGPASDRGAPPVAGDRTGFAGSGDDGWITVFSPSDPTRVRATDGARAQVIEREDVSVLRIGSPSGDQAVGFAVGQGILETLAGQEAVFNIVARSEEGRQTEMSVSCDFGASGDCGRSRFVVGPTRADYLFRVDLSAVRPSGGGTLTIVPDLSGEGGTLDIFEIRASPAQP